MAAQRGRQSAIAKHALSLLSAPLKARPEPPDTMLDSRPGLALWREIVQQFPADWFNEADLPMLEAYCRAVIGHRRISLEAAEAPFTIIRTNGGVGANPIFSIQARLASTMATLAIKLRISASSRTQRSTADTKMRRAERQAGPHLGTGTDGGGGRPWES